MSIIDHEALTHLEQLHVGSMGEGNETRVSAVKTPMREEPLGYSDAQEALDDYADYSDPSLGYDLPVAIPVGGVVSMTALHWVVVCALGTNTLIALVFVVTMLMFRR